MMNQENLKIRKVSRNLRNVLLGVTLLACLISSLVVILYSANENIIEYADLVQINDLEVCNFTYSQSGVPKSVTVCGYVVADKTARLRIVLYGMPGKQFLDEVPKDKDLFGPGYFSREIPIDVDGVYKTYLVEVILFREVIEVVRFDIESP